MLTSDVSILYFKLVENAEKYSITSELTKESSSGV